MVTFGVFIVILTMIIMPVSAWSDEEPHTPDDIDEMYGSWDSSDEGAEESIYGIAYRSLIVFEYDNIEQDGDSYKIHVDYDGHTPGYPWNYETLGVEYRWGTSGSWIVIAYLNFNAADSFYEITDASSTTIQIRFVDSSIILDATKHTWFFGSEPHLWVYWE